MEDETIEDTTTIVDPSKSSEAALSVGKKK